MLLSVSYTHLDVYKRQDLIKDLSGKQPIQGISLWLFSFEIYHELQPAEDFANFLKWFPTLLKDCDDILKLSLIHI